MEAAILLEETDAELAEHLGVAAHPHISAAEIIRGAIDPLGGASIADELAEPVSTQTGIKVAPLGTPPE
jgi:hypothetical protein